MLRSDDDSHIDWDAWHLDDRAIFLAECEKFNTHEKQLFCALVVPLPWLLAGGAREPRRAALRSLALLLVVLALARPIWRTGEAPAHHVLVVDATSSLSEAARAGLAQRVDVDVILVLVV